MRAFLASLRKDLLRYMADPAALLLWVGIPVVIGSLMSLVMGGSGGPRPVAQLLLVDEDQSFLTELLGSMGGGDDTLVHVETVEREEGFAAIDEGEGSALLVIPEGFTEDLLLEAPVVLELVTNPAQRILPGILQEGLALFSEVAFYGHRLLGEPIRELAEGPEDGGDFFPEMDTARIAVEFQRRFERMGDRLFPPAIQLETHIEEEDDAPSFSIGALFFPGLVYMGLLFMCLGLSLDVWNERGMGTLHRALVAPSGVWPFVAGKLAAGAIVLVGICVIGLLLGTVAYDFAWSTFPLALAWTVFSGTAFLALFLLLQGSARSQRGGNVLGSLILFPLVMAGGSFFPFEAMPDWMAGFGRWTPNGLAVEELKGILFQRPPSGRLGVATLVLFLAAAAAVAALVRRLRRDVEGA